MSDLRASVAACAIAACCAAWGGPCAAQTTRPAEGPPPPDAAAGHTDTQPASAPQALWGEPSDGLACRIVVEGRFRVGQPVTATIELKNLSDRTRYVLERFSPQYGEYATLTLTTPDGNEIRPALSSRLVPQPALFKAMGPGEVRRMVFTDLRGLFRAGLDVPGRYRLAYTFTGPAPQRVRTGIRMVGNQPQDVYTEPTAAQVRDAWTATVASAPVELELSPPVGRNLIVHEWGVFTVFNDQELANADLKQEWESMPDFFYRQFPSRRLGYMPASWRKPIVYFYTDLPALRVQAEVTFARGAPVVWWPCCSAPADDAQRPAPATVFRSLQWTGWLGGRVPSDNYTLPPSAPQWLDGKEQPLPAGSWLADARIEGPASFCSLSRSRTAGAYPETEQFLYYDGLAPAPDYLRCQELTDQAVTVRSAAAFPIRNLLLIDRRRQEPNQPVRFARVGRLDPNGRAAADWSLVPARRWPAAPAADLRGDLLEAGLFPPEADSVLKIWNEGFFHRPGLTAIYVLPRAEFDRMVSLAVDPQPVQTVRVGVALHCHLEGASTVVRRAQQLVEQLDDPSYRVRQRATEELAKLGPAAMPVLRRALRQTTVLEARVRLRQVLEALDAAEYLHEDP